MENQHLTYFKVENFKKFDSLEVKDIGQFNLIVGDNNVGKTCFLEALLFNTNNNIFKINLVETLRRRGLIEFELKNNHIYLKKKLFEKGLKNKVFKNAELGVAIFSFLFKKASVEKITLKASFYNDKYFDLDIYDLLHDPVHLSSISDIDSYNPSIPFISFNRGFEEDIYDLYNDLKTISDKKNLIRVIKVIDLKIVDVELRQTFEDLKSVFLLSFNDKDEFVPINYLGDGFKRIFYIILKVLSLKGKRIMIDEIEIGIHHSRQKDFWLNIITICNELNVQLFATTHSNECIEAFLKASKEINEENNIRLIELKEYQSKIYAQTLTSEEIQSAIDSDINLRGGNIYENV